MIFIHMKRTANCVKAIKFVPVHYGESEYRILIEFYIFGIFLSFEKRDLYVCLCIRNFQVLTVDLDFSIPLT